MQETSLSLIQRLAADGNDADWQKMLAIYRPFVFQRVSTYPLLVDQAEDIVQETVMVLMRELPTFERQRTGSFRAWLRGIVLNQLRYAARRSKKTPTPVGNSEKLLEQIEQLSDPSSEASEDFNKEHDKAVFRNAAAIVQKTVQPTTWKAFQKHVINGEEVSQVAEDLNVSVNVVLLAKSRLTRRIREEIRGMVE